jgi:hypothetical protein
VLGCAGRLLPPAASIAEEFDVAQRLSEELGRATEKAFYDAAAIEDVIEVRNPAKHRGRFPGVADVNALVARIALVLERNSLIYLGLPLSNVSFADMIEDDVSRALIKLRRPRIASRLRNIQKRSSD